MKRLVVDLDKCRLCDKCVANCSYYHHKDNKGVNALIEYLTFSLVCRQCDDAPCIASCYHEALYKLDDGRVKRSNYLCTSCKSCYLACPFGTILPEMLDYISSACDVCSQRGGVPLCVQTCPHKAIEFKDIEKENIEEGLFFVDDKFAVKTTKWFKDDLIFRVKKKK